LITTRHAAEQGRAVLALPGPVDSPASAGTLKLIRDGATLIRSVEDIVEELDGVSAPASKTPAPLPPNLDQTQTKVWNVLAEQPRAIDEIIQQIGVPTAQLTSTLLTMEMRKIIRRLPGNRYERA